MAMHLTAYPQQPGETMAQCLARAYEASKWSDPSVRQSLLEAETKKINSEWRRRVDIDKAKAAGRVVKSRSVPVSDDRELGKTWKDELTRQWERVAG